MTEEVGLYSLPLTLPTDCGAHLIQWVPAEASIAKVRVSGASPTLNHVPS